MKASVLQFQPHFLDRDYNLGKIVGNALQSAN